MSDEQNLPGDVALLAISAECERRGGIHYGDFIAQTTLEERKKIVEEYKARGKHKDRTRFTVKTISGRSSCK